MKHRPFLAATLLAVLPTVLVHPTLGQEAPDPPDIEPLAPTVEVNFSFGQKTFGDYDYEFVDATMRGAIQREDGSTGEYTVPIKLAYPVDGGERRGRGRHGEHGHADRQQPNGGRESPRLRPGGNILACEKP